MTKQEQIGNKMLVESLALEQGAILTKIIDQAAYGSDRGLLIEVTKAKTILDEAKVELIEIVNRGAPRTLVQYSYEIVKWLEKWLGFPEGESEEEEINEADLDNGEKE